MRGRGRAVGPGVALHPARRCSASLIRFLQQCLTAGEALARSSGLSPEAAPRPVAFITAANALETWRASARQGAVWCMAARRGRAGPLQIAKAAGAWWRDAAGGKATLPAHGGGRPGAGFPAMRLRRARSRGLARGRGCGVIHGPGRPWNAASADGAFGRFIDSQAGFRGERPRDPRGDATSPIRGGCGCAAACPADRPALAGGHRRVGGEAR